MGSITLGSFGVCFATGSTRERILKHVAQEFQQRHAETNTLEVLLLLAALATIVVALWYVSQFVNGEREQPPRPRRLFWQLGRAHGLKTREIMQLWSFSRRRGLEDPNVLFVAPEVFFGLAEGQGTREAVMIRRLGERIFAGLEDRAVADHLG